MRTLTATLLVTFGWASPVLAASGTVMKGMSILIILFLGFVALVIVFQLVPGLVLFISMLKGLFVTAKKAPVAHEKK